MCVYLSLDDIEQEVRAAASAQQMAQTQGLVEALHLFQYVRRWSPWGSPEHRSKPQNV